MKNVTKNYLLAFTILLGACGKKESGAWSSFKPLDDIEKNIQGYYDASLGQSVNAKSGNPSVYIDFSDGLVQAYTENPLNGQIVQAICNKLLNPEIEWYSLAASKITKLEYNSNQLYNKVSDAKEYKDIMAPIQETVKKITSSKNDALLITDFEEYTSDGKEQFENYPKVYFTDWIKKGNSITFFYTDYTETNKKSKITSKKHLYFTVFTHGKATEKSMVSLIREALKGRYSPKVFELNNTPYTISNDYGGKENTGINNQQFSKWVNYNFNGYKESNLPYEVIGINKTWDDKTEKYIQNIISKENRLFLSKLILNASDQTCFKLNKVGLKAYDVSNDYEKYAQSTEATKHIPSFTTNSKKDTVWDDKSNKDAITKLCFKTNSLDLKEEWVYKTSDLSKQSWPEVFDYDKEIFAGHLKNDPSKISLNIIINPNYKFKNITNKNALIRIDFNIDDATFNDGNSQLTDFQWSSVTIKEKPNKSLSEAIRNTLQETSPKGNIIYSYYIKFGNNKQVAK